MTSTPNPKQKSTTKQRSQLPPIKEGKTLDISTMPQLRRSSRLISNTSGPPASESPSKVTSASPPPKIDESQTYAGILATILDATDNYLGLGPITTELEVHTRLREWIESMSKFASPSELEGVLQDMGKYIDTVLVGLGEVTDVESENKLWELELRRMGYVQLEDGSWEKLGMERREE